MPNLGQIIREIQREAAALPTDALRTRSRSISTSRTRLSASTSRFQPGGRTVEDLIIANSAVMVSVLTTALYVRELATRPRLPTSRSASVPTSPYERRGQEDSFPLARLGPRKPRNAHNLSERKLRHAQL